VPLSTDVVRFRYGHQSLRPGIMDASSQFLLETAAKHFVFVVYKARRPQDPEGAFQLCWMSCFVVEVHGTWFVMTAGHVIRRMKERIAAGVRVWRFELYDRLAGNDFPGIPFEFDPEQWGVVEDIPLEGTDYAIAMLSSIQALGLAKGGVVPVSEHLWGPPPYAAYDQWLLVGAPDEGYKFQGGIHHLNLTIIPLTPCDPPSGVSRREDARVWGKIVTQPDKDKVYIENIEGMSGGPIFGLKRMEGGSRYWVIGIQSSWFHDSRIVSFCPVPPFLNSVKQAVEQLVGLELGQEGKAGGPADLN